VTSKAKGEDWGNCGSQKGLTVTGRKMTRHRGVAWCKSKVIRKKTGPGTRLSEKTGEYGQLRKDYGRARRGEWKKRHRRQTAAIFQEGENNREWHQRVELRRAITSGKWRNAQEDPV
jgi:hypothetical protein